MVADFLPPLNSIVASLTAGLAGISVYLFLKTVRGLELHLVKIQKCGGLYVSTRLFDSVLNFSYHLPLLPLFAECVPKS